MPHFVISLQNGRPFLTCYCCCLILSHERFDQGVCSLASFLYSPRELPAIIYMHRHNYIYACMYYLHVNYFAFILHTPVCIVYMQTYFQILCSLCLQVCIRIYVKHLAFKLTQNQSERASIFVLKSFISIFGGRPLFEFFSFFWCRFLYVRACARACMHAHVHALVFL